MPTKKLKDVSFDSLEELNTRCDLNKIAPNQLLSLRKTLDSADKLFMTASKNYEDGDEETAYQLYMRFIQLCTILPKLKDYDKKFVSLRLSKKPLDATQRCEELSQSLQRRYDLKREAAELLERESVANGTENGGSGTPPTNRGFEQDATNGKQEVEKLNILPTELFDWIRSGLKSFIILDIRWPDDFLDATFLTPRVVNVPLNKVSPGLTALNIEESLRGESRQLFRQRHTVDYVVLSDYSSDLSTMEEISTIKIVSDAVYLWDSVAKLKNRPIILTGGFQNWVMYYPSACTNIGNNIRPVVTRNEIEETVSTPTVIEYPSLAPKKEVLPPSVTKTNTNGHRRADTKDIRSETPPVDESEIEDLPTAAYPTLPGDADLFDRLSRVDISGRLAPKDDGVSLPSPMDLAKIVREDVVRPLVPDRKLKPAGGQDIVFVTPEVKPLLAAVSSVVPDLKPSRSEEDEGEYVSVKLPDAEKADLEATIQRLTTLNAEKDAEIKRRQEVESIRRQRKLKEKQNVLPSSHDDEHLQPTEPTPAQPTVVLEEPTPQPAVSVTPLIETPVVRPQPVIPPKPPSVTQKPIAAEVKPVPKPITTSVASEEIANKPVTAGAHLGDLMSGGGMKRSVSSPNIAKLVAAEAESNGDNVVEPVKKKLPPKVINQTREAVKEQPKTKIPLDDYTKFVMERRSQLQGIVGGKGRYLTGLRNLGNTCFLNSILQCLSNTEQLSNYFCSGQFLQHINPDNKMGYRGQMALEFSVVMSSLASGQYRHFAPTSFRNTVSRCKPEFGGYDQQDSQEFLNFLLDSLHEDLNGAAKTTVAQQDNDRLTDRQAACSSWQSHLIHNSSIFVNLLQGQYKSTVKCRACGHQSRTFDTFMFLSVPVLRQSCRLKDCLEAYLEPELMSGSSRYLCPKCKEYRDAEKFIQLWKLPQILLIHFKRFQWEGQWRSKINAMVDFPTTGLDMSPYVIGETPRGRYNLYAVSHHTGNLEGGHYTAMCRNQNGRWYLYDDQDVHEMSSSRLKSSGAYILCYSLSNS